MGCRLVFAEHQPLLARASNRPAGFTAICKFALCTIRMPLHSAVADCHLLLRGETNVRSIFGTKHRGLSWLDANGADLWEDCERTYDQCGRDGEDTLVELCMGIPGIGPAKAGFIVQMAYGLSGCIDTHNLTRFGLTDRTFRCDASGGQKVSPNRRRKLIARYNQFCYSTGGTAFLWDSWCAYVAERDPVNYRDADYVSALHLAPIGG
jgi:hypothetical protein